jgi:hypothetical protein
LGPGLFLSPGPIKLNKRIIGNKMATLVLTKNYRARNPFNPNFGIGDPENNRYLDSLVKWSMAKIKAGAKPFHEKYGTPDKGAAGKIVSITSAELKQKIIDSKGLSPDGVKIYFGNIGVLNKPGQAIKVGLMTSDENNRKPSFDRIDSSIKEYSNDNVQVTTKSYNISKGSDDSYSTTTQDIKVKVKNIEFTIDNCSPQFLAHYTQSLAN